MRSIVLVALIGLGGVGASVLDEYPGPGNAPVSVLHVAPDTPLGPADPLTITFDRPVAPALEDSVDPRSVLRVDPEVGLDIFWRDPATLVLVPDSLWPADTRFEVRFDPGLAGVDGSDFAGPLTHEFRTAAPRVLDVDVPPGQLGPRSHALILLDGIVSLERLVARSRIRGRRQDPCGPWESGIAVLEQRDLRDSDPDRFRNHFQQNRWQPTRPKLDLLRKRARVLEVSSEAPLGRDCPYTLFLPESFPADADTVVSVEDRRGWFRGGGLAVGLLPTPGLTEASCLAQGACRVRFRTQMDAGAVAEYVRLRGPAGDLVFQTGNTNGNPGWGWSGYFQWLADPGLHTGDTVIVEFGEGLEDHYGQRLESGPQDTLVVPARRTGVLWPTFHFVPSGGEGRFEIPARYSNANLLRVMVSEVPDSLMPVLLRTDNDWSRAWGEEAAVSYVDVHHSEDSIRSASVEVEVDQGTVQLVRMDALRSSDPDSTRSERVLWRPDSLPVLTPVPTTADPSDANTEQTWEPVPFPVSLIQATDLAVHAMAGMDEAVVWVRGARDGGPREEAEVMVFDSDGVLRGQGTTDEDGLAHLSGLTWARPCETCQTEVSQQFGYEGYVVARAGSDRGIAPVLGTIPDHRDFFSEERAALAYHPGIPWNRRAPVRVTAFTERGLYRPGDSLFAQALAWVGPPGQLRPLVADSLRWHLVDPTGESALDSVFPLDGSGAGTLRMRLGEGVATGRYRFNVDLHRGGRWETFSTPSFVVDEYRPRRFEVAVSPRAAEVVAGDTILVEVAGSYLSGGAMAGADSRWMTNEWWGGHESQLIEGPHDWNVGGRTADEHPQPREGVGELGLDGSYTIELQSEPNPYGLARQVQVEAIVTDLDQQEITERTNVLVHPAALYPAVRRHNRDDPLVAGDSLLYEVRAVGLDGDWASRVDVQGALVLDPSFGSGSRMTEPDTVDSCTVRTERDAVFCRFTAPADGHHRAVFELRDARGRRAVTESVFLVGPRYGMEQPSSDPLVLSLDRDQYERGDTARVSFDSPFEDATALLTLQQSRMVEQRVIRADSGLNVVRVPVSDAMVPGVRVAVVLVEERTSADPGTAGLELGFGSLIVSAEPRRLELEVEAAAPVYRPADTARVRVSVRDALGHPRRSRVTVWAVDEGVLSITNQQTPDPWADLYGRGPEPGFVPSSNLIPRRGFWRRWRTLGNTLALSLDEVVVTGATAAGERQLSPIRTDFRSTAFFMASVQTDAEGRAEVRARLPDNLTEYRVMAVAVDSSGAVGSGESYVTVDRPLLARPILPRFVRPDDRVEVGAVLYSKLEQPAEVTVSLEAEGAQRSSPSPVRVVLDTERPERVGFDVVVEEGDSATFLVQAVTGAAGESDGARVALPVRPKANPIYSTVGGRLTGGESLVLPLEVPALTEGARLTVSFGSSPLGFAAGLKNRLDLYPYRCTSEMSSALLASVALWAAQDDRSSAESVQLAEDVGLLAAGLMDRQAPNGAFYFCGDYWSHWPFLAVQAGRALADAREAGFPVPDSVFSRLERHLAGTLETYVESGSAGAPAPDSADPAPLEQDWVSRSIDDLLGRWVWTERAYAVELLSRLGTPHVEAERALLEDRASLEWSDQLLLAQALLRRDDAPVGEALLEDLMSSAIVEGKTLSLPEQSPAGYGPFRSRVAPTAVLLDILLQHDPGHRLVGPAVERVVAWDRAEQARRGPLGPRWTSYDMGLAISSLSRYARRTRSRTPQRVTLVLPGDTVVLTTDLEAEEVEFALASRQVGQEMTFDSLPVRIESEREDDPVFFFLTLAANPAEALPDPLDQGIRVERWYEDVRTGDPVVEAGLGDPIRVRMRVSVPEERTFVVLDDPLPAGLEIVTLESVGLRGRTSWPGVAAQGLGGRGTPPSRALGGRSGTSWYSPWGHRETRDDRAVFSAVYLWPGTYDVQYLTRATTAGAFLYPPAHSEERYNPAVGGRSAGGTFTVRRR